MQQLYSTLLLAMLVAVLILAARAWTVLISRLKQGKPPLPLAPRRPVPWGLLDLCILVLCIFGTVMLGFSVLSGISGAELRDESLSPTSRAAVMAAFSVSSFLGFLLAISMVRMRTGATLADLGIRFPRWRKDVTLGCLAFGVVVVPVFLLQLALTQLLQPERHPIIDLLMEDPTPEFFLLSGVAALLVAPIVEEFLFRVFLQGWLENLTASPRPLGDTAGTQPSRVTRMVYGAPRRVPPHEPVAPDEGLSPNLIAEEGAVMADPVDRQNPYHAADVSLPKTESPDEDAATREAATEQLRPAAWPIAVSAALFAAAHYGHGTDPIPLFLLALGLGYVYQRTHRVLPCIVVHFLVNGISLAQLWLIVHAAP